MRRRVLQAGVCLAIACALMIGVLAQNAGPRIFANGVLNGASFLHPQLLSGSLAQGSIFSVFGENFASALVLASAFPLPAELGGVSVTVRQGTVEKKAIILAATQGQINAILPSDTPPGDVQLSVTAGGRTSQPVTVRVVEASPGIFSVATTGQGPGIITNFNGASDQPLNSLKVTAKPDQFVILWLTGLGPVKGADNLQPSAIGEIRTLRQDVEVFFGNEKSPEIFYSGRSAEFPGLDQVIARVPPAAPEGCYVPVAVRTNKRVSNFVSMGIARAGGPCNPGTVPPAMQLVSGGRMGDALLIRGRIRAGNQFLEPVANSVSTLAKTGLARLAGEEQRTVEFDAGLAMFADVPKTDHNYLFQTAPLPQGTCTVVPVSPQFYRSLGSVLPPALPGMMNFSTNRQVLFGATGKAPAQANFAQSGYLALLGTRTSGATLSAAQNLAQRMGIGSPFSGQFPYFTNANFFLLDGATLNSLDLTEPGRTLPAQFGVTRTNIPVNSSDAYPVGFSPIPDLPPLDWLLCMMLGAAEDMALRNQDQLATAPTLGVRCSPGEAGAPFQVPGHVAQAASFQPEVAIEQFRAMVALYLLLSWQPMPGVMEAPNGFYVGAEYLDVKELPVVD